MRSGDAISTLLGVGFLVCAGFILVRPGGALNIKFREWSEANRLRNTVREQWDELSNSGRLLGSSSSEPVLVQFLDYQCRYCRDFRDSLRIAFQEHPEYSVAVRYRISRQGRLSRESALAALCAAQQSQFEPMHDYLSTTTEWMATGDWEQVGRKIGIRDIPQWLTCLTSSKAEAVLAVDSSWALHLALRGTPTLVSKRAGVRFGVVPISTLERWLK